MGLPSLTLTGDLARDWRTVLEEDGLNVSQHEIGVPEPVKAGAAKRVTEVLWRLEFAGAELSVIEAIFRDRPNGNVVLIFMPIRTDSDGKLLSRVQDRLVAAGAMVGVRR